MTKLDEIESTFNGLNKRYPNDPEVVGVYAVKRMGLLIRAVRQLGAIVRERESASITRNRIEHGGYRNLIDPDVLELLEE